MGHKAHKLLTCWLLTLRMERIRRIDNQCLCLGLSFSLLYNHVCAHRADSELLSVFFRSLIRRLVSMGTYCNPLQKPISAAPQPAAVVLLPSKALVALCHSLTALKLVSTNAQWYICHPWFCQSKYVHAYMTNAFMSCDTQDMA